MERGRQRCEERKAQKKKTGVVEKDIEGDKERADWQKQREALVKGGMNEKREREKGGGGVGGCWRRKEEREEKICGVR